MPEHPFFPELLANYPAGNYTRTVGGNMGPITSDTEALAAEALATEEVLATEEALAIEALVMEALATEAPAAEAPAT